MNDLNTQQIVLLCLLVSFVTAVATGITIISLVGQSPQPVTQTINRVVERTVETIVEQPDDPSEPVIERVVETVVVNQEDLTVEAVANSSRSFVRIYRFDRFDNKEFVGLGLVVREDGTVITPLPIEPTDRLIIEYRAGAFSVDVLGGQTGSMTVLQPVDVGETTFVAATLGNSQNLKLAQSVIALSGQSSNTVATGIITGLTTASGEVTKDDISAETVPSESLTKIDTSLNASQLMTGALLMNLKGEVVGIYFGASLGSAFTPINQVKTSIPATE